jgi:hypothetical protein
MGRLSLHSLFAPHRGLVLLLVGTALLGGCATVPLPLETCEQFERNRRSTNYETVYAYAEAESRRAATSFARAPRGELATARWYTLRTNRDAIRTCDHLYLIKDLYLQRTADGSVTLHEQREFYTAKGDLIATKREDVTSQLKSTGFYTASVPLPIPQNAPAGRYRVVSRLIAMSPGKKEQTLGTTSAEFGVQ